MSKDLSISVKEHIGKVEKVKKSMCFDVIVNVGTNSKTLLKTYKDFKVLLYELKKSSRELSAMKLPHKKFFQTKSDAEILTERLQALNGCIQKFLTVASIVDHDAFQSFFGLTNKELVNKELYASNQCLNSVEDHNFDYIPQKVGSLKSSPLDFEALKVIGKGNFGRVYLVRHKLDMKYYAMKVLEKRRIISNNETHHIMNERLVLVQKHPFLVSLRFAFQTPKKLYFVLDYVNGGELFFHLKNEGCFTEMRTKFYCAEIGEALGYLHSQKIIYRDLKPENILLDSSGHVVLTDFGLAKVVSDEEKTNTFCGTPEYFAPEVIRNEPYDKAVDWWCYGCVTFEMLNGIPAFYNENRNEMYKMILSNDLCFHVRSSISAKGFIQALMQKESSQRLGSGPNDWAEVKSHSFLRSIPWDDLMSKKMTPPYVPDVADELDLKNIDNEFVSEEISSSIKCDTTNPMSDASDKNHFTGFTYVENNDFYK